MHFSRKKIYLLVSIYIQITARSLSRIGGIFEDCLRESILDFVNNCLESLRVIHAEVSEDLAVDIDAVGVEQTHELRIAETLKTGGSIDTLDPESAEVALLRTTIAECISQTFLPGILSNGPHILAGTNVTSGEVG